jgi:hypothetical protein
MRTILNWAFALIVVAGVSGCGGNNTYSPSFVGASSPTFRLSANPESRTVTQGNSTTYTVTATSIGGFDSTVTLSISGLPNGAGASFNPTSVIPSSSGTDSTLTITTTDGETTVAPGTYTLTITGSGGNVTQQTTVTLVVNPPAPPGSLNGTIQ